MLYNVEFLNKLFLIKFIEQHCRKCSKEQNELFFIKFDENYSCLVWLKKKYKMLNNYYYTPNLDPN